MKLLSVTVPCYNSQEYMRHCIETLLPGGEEIEILVVDDGSTGRHRPPSRMSSRRNTPPSSGPSIRRMPGHGGAVMKGLENATGLYFKVVDSDDWWTPRSLRT